MASRRGRGEASARSPRAPSTQVFQLSVSIWIHHGRNATRLGKLSNSTGPFGEGVSPSTTPAVLQSTRDTRGQAAPPRAGGRTGGSGTVSFLREKRRHRARLRPCSKCSRGSGGASPGLCTRGARSPRWPSRSGGRRHCPQSSAGW